MTADQRTHKHTSKTKKVGKRNNREIERERERERGIKNKSKTTTAQEGGRPEKASSSRSHQVAGHNAEVAANS